jgi:uncharacterized membrane protein YqjE
MGPTPFRVIRILLSAGGPLLAQADLHGQLARVEWEELKSRLLKMVVLALLCYTGIVCVMLLVGALVLAFGWDTEYRIPIALALVAIYALATALAWRWFRALSAQSSQAFAATRDELAADLAVLRSNL